MIQQQNNQNCSAVCKQKNKMTPSRMIINTEALEGHLKLNIITYYIKI